MILSGTGLNLFSMADYWIKANARSLHMTESQAHQTTESSAKKSQKRLNYEKQRSEVTRLKLQRLLQETGLKLVTPLDEIRGAKRKYVFQCACGAEFSARPVDMFRNTQSSCRSCSSKRRMSQYVLTEAGRQHLNKMTENAAQHNTKDAVWHSVYVRCNSAADRCKRHPNYHGRGIEFRFASPAAMTAWILANLGPPKKGQSIDRIDNDGHYEAGNLRWANRKTQNSNKREYKGSVYGNRIKRLMELTDYGYESIRTFINKGMTDDDIINKKRHPSGRPSVRHSKLRTEE